MVLAAHLTGRTSSNWALEHVRAYVVSVVMLLEPVGATLLAVLVLGRGEVPGPVTVAGGAAVLAGAWLSIRARAGAGGGGRTERTSGEGVEA